MRSAGRLARRMLSLDHVPPEQFARCQWQVSPTSRAYLVYRWLLLLVLLSTTVCSFAYQVYPADPAVQLNYFKWFIFLTHWGLVLCVLQSALALAVVHRGRAGRSLSISCESGGTDSLEADDTASEYSGQVHTPPLCRVYWLTHTLATDFAFVISLVYWALVHDPKIHRVDALNVLQHVCNSALMLLELLLTSHPVRPLHVLYTVALGTVYGAFSWLYYLAGGTGRANEPAIYAALDWRRPASAVGFVGACALVMCAAHALAALVAWARARAAARWRAAPPPSLDKVSALRALE